MLWIAGNHFQKIGLIDYNEMHVLGHFITILLYYFITLIMTVEHRTCRVITYCHIDRGYQGMCDSISEVWTIHPMIELISSRIWMRLECLTRLIRVGSNSRD